jgi:hypothetical protein
MQLKKKLKNPRKFQKMMIKGGFKRQKSNRAWVNMNGGQSMSLLINGLYAQSLRLPCEMRSLFLWGYAQKIILGISNRCLPAP